MTERRKFTTRERIGVITESGFSAEGLALSGSPRAMRALEELISVLCDTVLGQREQIARVRDLHCLTVDELDGPEGPEDVEHCQECGYISIDAEPCPTLLALDGPQ